VRGDDQFSSTGIGNRAGLPSAIDNFETAGFFVRSRTQELSFEAVRFSQRQGSAKTLLNSMQDAVIAVVLVRRHGRSGANQPMDRLAWFPQHTAP